MFPLWDYRNSGSGIIGDDVSTPEVTCVYFMSNMRNPMSDLRDLVPVRRLQKQSKYFWILLDGRDLSIILGRRGWADVWATAAV